ncbi:proteasome accessory factor C [Saccharopolyspora erythraea NRRL 2338]|uniref:Transcriptional regulator-like protein n=2 Tax=Saccharopolyspora erythraea TaxID=1836 RepID=A4FBZ0_SACEN|nr:YafY family protein [Saccharopolyspora erythraea]EQD84081.1 protein pafC [Saccharopolyspora erythraea D]PFG95337.1 proteasome accessory factor C [Saccharopolyspora erythraea NRRL 2338]QRK91981.1 YafY family transcriptional regulator [Saccharopolyspora erythraea]CAM01565.1 transcriptional regulator-like protein [Saccharopolyspora erythraea NRRL 2338]
MRSATERLPRLLALVPYLLSRPGIPVADAAADFGVSEQQLRRDLELLWMCGLPGYGPGDLIDLSFESDTVTVTYDAGMNRPLRLTASEATALLVALRALAETPGITDTDAVQRALAKVEDAVGQARPAGVVVGLAGREGPMAPGVREAVQEATTGGRALRMRYYTASRDEISERTVDPMRLLLIDGRSYLEAWCRQAEGMRLFRLDRIDDIEVLPEPAQPPPDAHPADFSEGLFRPAPEQRMAELELEPDARWVAEYYPVDDLVELPGGRARVRMRYSDRSWMVRLVLGQGGRVRVSGPDDLACDVRQRAEEALTRARHLPST